MSLKYPNNHIGIHKILGESALELPCQNLIRYIDPSWKRYGYPHLTGDLRVDYNHSVCEGTSIHVDDVSVFINRLERYMKSTLDKTRVATTQITTKVAGYYHQAQGVMGGSNSSQQDSTIQTTETPQMIVGQVVQKNRGCGCGRRR